MSENIMELDLFMMCETLNKTALAEMPKGFCVRRCRKNELEIWKALPFDDPEQARQHNSFMTDYFNAVYAKEGDLFFKRCLFACDSDDRPVGTCFIWKAYGSINTIHWLKVKKEYEGRGIGRALLSMVMKDLSEDEYPIYLHTHPDCYRAIKLYSDFGFALLSNPLIGSRNNGLPESLPVLADFMPREAFYGLRITVAPESLLQAAASSQINEF